MLDSVCSFIRRYTKKNENTRSQASMEQQRGAKSVQGRRMTGRWTDNKPLVGPELGTKQLPLGKNRRAQRKKASRSKEADIRKEGSSSPGASETYEISMKDMENKKTTNIQLQIRRPTGCPNAMKRDLQKFNIDGTYSDEVDDSRGEGEADIGTCVGGRKLSLSQQTLLVVVTNVSKHLNDVEHADDQEDWYPGKERDDISSDNPYFGKEKKNKGGEMNKKESDDTIVSSDLISDCDEPGAITIGQRLSDVYDKKQNFNRDDVYE